MKKSAAPTTPPLGTERERLAQYTGTILFPAKLKRAQETLARVGLPAAWEAATPGAAEGAAGAGAKTKPVVKPASSRPKKAA